MDAASNLGFKIPDLDLVCIGWRFVGGAGRCRIREKRERLNPCVAPELEKRCCRLEWIGCKISKETGAGREDGETWCAKEQEEESQAGTF